MNNLLESRQEPIPGYRLIERLGRGGYGDVWKVEAPGGFMKAMKFVFGDLGNESDAAEQELGALRQLVQIRHPFILSVERCDVLDGQVLITMELADRSLEDRYHECQAQGLPGIPGDELLRYMAEAAEALDLLAHEYRLQHLDIKPTNLFLVRKHVKVGDFGLVRQLEEFEAPVRTGLTPLYAPPESYEGRISLNSDQYSLALVYHEMLTGRRAITGENGRELMFRTLVEGPDLTAVDENVRRVLARALAKSPADRFGGCVEFIDAIRKACRAAGLLGPISGSLPAPPPTTAAPAFDDAAERERFDAIKPGSTLLDGADENVFVARYRARRAAHQRRASVATLASAPRPECTADGTLQPTLVLGLGGFGIRMGEQVRAALDEQFGEAAEKLPVHLLHIDVDPESVRKAAVREASLFDAPFVVCRLRKAAEYRTNWETSKHLSSWLEQEQIFRIGPTGETRGRRALGRLALVDNFERVAQQVLASLSTLLSVETADEVRQSTGLRYRRSAPAVVIAAGMGGGSGAGMAIDVAYVVRAILEAAGVDAPSICLALAAGVDPHRERDLQIANQFAFANDLAAFASDECEYAFPVQVEGLPAAMAGPPARRMLFFDAEAEHLPTPHDRAVAEAFAEYVVQTATGGHDALMPEEPGPPAPFVGVGWFSLAHPHDRVLCAAGSEFAVRVVERWLEPLSEEEMEARRRSAREFFEKNGYEPSKVGELLQQEATREAGEPFHVQAAWRVNQLIEALEDRAAKNNPQPVYEARTDLRRLLGGDPVDDDEVPAGATPYETAFRKAAAIVSERLFDPIRQELESAVEAIDRRFEVVRGVWTGFSDALAGLIKRFVESAKTRDLEREAYDAAYHLHKLLVLGSNPRQYVAAVERWIKTKLEFNGRQQLIRLYQMLKSQIEGLAVQIFTAPRKLTAVREHLRSIRDDAVAPRPSLVRQSLYLEGAVTIHEALEVYRAAKGEPDLDRLEEALRADIFTPAGGLWKTCAREEVPAEALADDMAAATASWLLHESRIQDAADVFLLRNRESPDRLQRELKAFWEWSAPSFVSKAATPGAKRIQETLTVLLPSSAAGQELASLILDAGDGFDARFAVHPGTEVHFVRTAAAASLGRLAPAWLLRGKQLFESPKFRGAAAIFPQTVDV